MSPRKLPTVLIGFGKVGSAFAEDPVMARHYPYASHAQVLADHPAFDWKAVVDPSEEALDRARQKWAIPHAVKALEDLPGGFHPEVAVLATPPGNRIPLLEKMTSLRAVIVEKPLGRTPAEADAFLQCSHERGLLVQVNLWRRCDDTFRGLALGGLGNLLGRIQGVFGLYGNGLLNNGTHMVDFARMLFGEIAAVQAVAGVEPYPEGPIEKDVNVPFLLVFQDRRVAFFQSLRFGFYRENSLDIWGEKGRLALMQEGLVLSLHPLRENRAMQGEFEIASDQSEALRSTVGSAFYRLYDNLANALLGGAELWSPGSSALESARVIDAILESSHAGGRVVALEGKEGRPAP